VRLVTRCFAAAALAVACATPRPMPPSPTPAATQPPAAVPAPPPPAAPARVLYGPSALRYVMHQRLHVEQDYGMGTQVQDLGYRVYVSATITGPADSVGYPTTLTADSIVLDSGSVLPPPLSVDGARGLAYRGRLTPQGEFRKAVPSDSGQARLTGQILGGFRNFYLRLPHGGVAPGTSWTDTVATTDTAGAAVVITRGATDAHAAASSGHGGVQSLEIRFASSLVLSGGGDANGQTFTIEGQSTETGMTYVALDGRYLGGETADSTELAFVFPMAGRLPGRRVVHVTIQVLP
jgi:hypothetical protein